MNSPSDFLCCSFRKWGTSSLATDVEMLGSKQGLGNKKPTFASQRSLEISSFFWPIFSVFDRKSSMWISFGRETECARALSRFTGVIWLEGRRTWFHSKLIPWFFWISTSQSRLRSWENLENYFQMLLLSGRTVFLKGQDPSTLLPAPHLICLLHSTG